MTRLTMTLIAFGGLCFLMGIAVGYFAHEALSSVDHLEDDEDDNVVMYPRSRW